MDEAGSTQTQCKWAMMVLTLTGIYSSYLFLMLITQGM